MTLRGDLPLTRRSACRPGPRRQLSGCTPMALESTKRPKDFSRGDGPGRGLSEGSDSQETAMTHSYAVRRCKASLAFPARQVAAVKLAVSPVKRGVMRG